MIRLRQVADALEQAGLLVSVSDILPAEVTGVSGDTREIDSGSLFIAVRGAIRDGHDFLGDAAEHGASAALVEDPSRTALPSIVVRNGRKAAAVAAAVAYDHPARSLRLVGITGTNGKTTTASIIRHICDSPAGRAASIGTLGALLGSEGITMPGGGGLTTPGPVELQRLLRELVDAGVRTVAMEVSSHSLDQHRVDGVLFDAVVFTNLTRDHLDYHHTMEAYLSAKAKLMNYLKPGGTAIVNADEPEWAALPPAERCITYSIREAADLVAEDVRYTPGGSEWNICWRSGDEMRECLPVMLPLLGSVNVQNALAASGAALALGVPLDRVAAQLSGIPQVSGRLEKIWDRPLVLRDYAHTPDALSRALDTARGYTSGKLLVVFGCGGERDRGKRPLMGRIAEEKADICIVTSDNPRTEDPEDIINDIESGMSGNGHERFVDRRRAIERAMRIAADDDLILLAGKGHETYQIRGTESHHFDESEIVREIASARDME